MGCNNLRRRLFRLNYIFKTYLNAYKNVLYYCTTYGKTIPC